MNTVHEYSTPFRSRLETVCELIRIRRAGGQRDAHAEATVNVLRAGSLMITDQCTVTVLYYRIESQLCHSILMCRAIILLITK